MFLKWAFSLENWKMCVIIPSGLKGAFKLETPLKWRAIYVTTKLNQAQVTTHTRNWWNMLQLIWETLHINDIFLEHNIFFVYAEHSGGCNTHVFSIHPWSLGHHLLACLAIVWFSEPAFLYEHPIETPISYLYLFCNLYVMLSQQDKWSQFT